MVTLITLHGKPTTVCVDRNAFTIEDGVLIEDACQRAGSKFYGELEEYEKNLELARFAFENNIYDKIEENSRYLR